MDEAYRILGLNSAASPEEVKRAYRKLVMQWHPDRNGSPEAEEQFKRIKAAYEVITDPEKYEEWKATHGRRKADRPWNDFSWFNWGSGHRSSKSNHAGNGSQGGSQHSQHQGHAWGRRRENATAEDEARANAYEAHRGPATEEDEDSAGEPHIHRVVSLSLLEAAFGCEKTVTVVESSPCEPCGGSGVEHHARSMPCRHCSGIGRIRDKKEGNITCPHCKGRGFVSSSPCASCEGSGESQREKNFKVRIPAGVLEGDRVRLAGGADGQDMYLAITVAPKGLLRLHGRDLHCELPVSVFRLLLGGEVAVPSLTGTTHLHLEPGTGLKPGESAVHRLHGQGFPGRGTRKTGDLVVRLKAIFPASLSERQREALQKLDDNLKKKQKDQAPELAAWDAELAKWLDALPNN